MHSPWSRAVLDPKRIKPRANSGLSFSGAHLLDPQYPTTRSRSVPLSIVPPYAYHLEPSLWESAKTTVATEGPAHLVPTAPAGPESIPSYEEKPLLPARQDYTQVDWLPYSIEPLPTVAEELSEEHTEEGEVHRLPTQSEPPPATQVQDQKVNMSVISYPYPAPLDYERGHHYHPNLNSTITSNPPMSGYDPLHPADDGHHQSVGSLDDSAGSYSMSHEFPPSHVLNALANSTSSSSSPTSVSSKEAELARLRRKNNYTRRQSKTKIRRQRSVEPPTTAYLPRSCGQDYGLGIQYSSAPGMQASITSQPMGGPPFMEPYEETISPAVQHVYPPEYYGHPAEFTLDNYQMSYAVHGASESPQAMYPPYTVPTLPSISVSAPHVGGGADAMYATAAVGANRGLSHSPGAEEGVRVITARPKPQCWDHGCNGRQFSTFSNLLRHQREKSGTATKSYCPKCGAEFTRTTARNGHMAHEKCKPRTEA